MVTVFNSVYVQTIQIKANADLSSGATGDKCCQGHHLYMRAGKSLASRRVFAVLLEHSLLDNTINTKIPCAGLNKM